jgi:putative transposase
MPRRPRAGSGGLIFHVLNRAALGAPLFATDRDCDSFEALMVQARARIDLPLLAYILMPTHFHLVVWPRKDWQLSEYMRWLTLTYTVRVRTSTQTVGTGALVQGRYKPFPVQQDDHFYRVCRYVERNALRAGLCTRAESWPWSSLAQRCRNCTTVQLDPWPVPQPVNWIEYVNQPQSEGELNGLRDAAQRGVPYGNQAWAASTAKALNLGPRVRRRGRPRRPTPASAALIDDLTDEDGGARSSATPATAT